ncbi:MAG: Gfo/Idh/MocA family protein [Candidatus Hodarchaeota archaeon]
MSEPINVGFVGGGPRSRSIFNTLVMNKQFEDAFLPLAVVDTNPETSNDWRYLVENCHVRLDELLKEEELDAVVIVTPPATHASLATKCLEAGLHVWSEVPMGLSLDELWFIIDAERANKGNGGKYAFGENYCWYIGNQYATKLVENGVMGEIFYMEGLYHHSVEHYMITENFLENKEIDPETSPKVTPTWRATLPPITYGHAGGPCLYVLNKQKRDKPIEVSAFGNMKMQKRFNNDNFQIGLYKTRNGAICKFGSGFVLPHHGKTQHIYWGTRCVYEAPHSYFGDHYLYVVPKDQAYYPARHKQRGEYLNEDDLKKRGARHAEGGHGGADTLMFTDWLASLRREKPYDIDAVKGAEMTALGIIGNKAIKDGKLLEVPDFGK